MFTSKISTAILPGKPNLKSALGNPRCKSHLFSYKLTIRNFSLEEVIRNVLEKQRKLKASNSILMKSLRNTFVVIPRNLKNQSADMLRVWAHQCECVIAQRVRRAQQMFTLYTKLWEERELKELLTKMRQQFTKRGKELVFSAMGVVAYNWDQNRISIMDMEVHFNELDYIHLLTEQTMLCDRCREELQRNSKTPNVNMCRCTDKRSVAAKYDNWEPFLEKEDMLVWRKENKDHPGQYEYKVYGSYSDVAAEDFLNVQIDTEYRKQWDNTAITLEVVEKDPQRKSNSDIIYWEMLWPRFFSNRDYVFNRRFMVDWDNKTVVIISRNTTHPRHPVKADKVRVLNYWSTMVIKPYSELDKPGIEFGLTYFDNPGVNIPSAVQSWVAKQAMPDFLIRLRKAAQDYRSYCIGRGRSCIFNFQYQRKMIDDEIHEMEGDDYEDCDLITDNTIFEARPRMGKSKREPFQIDNRYGDDFNNSLADFLEDTDMFQNLISSDKDDANEDAVKDKKPTKTDNEPSRDTEMKLIENETRFAEISENIAMEVMAAPSAIGQDDSYWKYLRPNYYFS